MMRPPRLPLAVVALASLAMLAACSTAHAPTSTPVTAVGAREVEAPVVTLDLEGDVERVRVQGALETAGYRVAPGAAARLTDREVEGAEAVTVAGWAIVAHPRVERLDLTLDGATAILAGEVDAWEQLDPAARALPLTLIVAEEAAPWLQRTHRPDLADVEVLTTAEALARAAAEPGAVALVPFDAPVLGVLALTVDGHDPYRDPEATAPVADRRWVEGADAAEVARLASLAGWAPPAHDPAGILATGELIPARCAHTRLVEAGFDAMFEATRDLIAAADYAIAPWEPSVVDAPATPCVSTFNLQAAPEAVTATADAGFDLAFTVGNHLGDCWTGCSAPSAVRSTVEAFRAHDMATVGAGDDLSEASAHLVVEIDGVRFAFLAYDDIAREFYGATDQYAGTNPLILERLAEQVRVAKAEADHVVLGFSWGVEYVADPSSRQREAVAIAMEAGASLVIGNHPHWVQATQRVGDGWAAYALGNFVFDQDWSVATQQGAILEVGFTRDRILGVRLRPIVIEAQHRPVPVAPTSEAGRTILGRIWDATDRLARD